MFLHVDEPETVVARAVRRGSATARGSASPPSCSRTPARACASASPTSASSPRPAGWSALQRLPELRAALQGPPRRPHAGGVRDLDRHRWCAWRPASATPQLDPDTDERFVPLRRELGRHELRPQPDPAPPRPARAHPPPRAPGGGLPRARGHAHADRRGRGARARPGRARARRARGAAPARQPAARRGLLLLALGGAGEHVGRDGEAFESWEQETGAPPQEVPLPEDEPVR